MLSRRNGQSARISRTRQANPVSKIIGRSGNPIASSAVRPGPEWDDLCAVTRVACQWPARVTNARFWPVTDGSFCGWDRTRAAHREDVFTAEAGRPLPLGGRGQAVLPGVMVAEGVLDAAGGGGSDAPVDR